MKKIKNQKGAISLFVLLSMLFFLIFVLGAYTLVSRRVQTQTMTLTDLKGLYKEDSQSMSDSKYASDKDVIPIYNADQFLKIGSNEYVEVNGKIYKFGSNETNSSKKYSYILRGNIVIDIDKYFSEADINKIEFLDSKFYSDDYQIDKAEYDLYYYKEDKTINEKAYWKLVFYQDTEKILFTADEKTNIGTKYVLGDDKYSILNDLDKYIFNSNYEFLLMYNEDVNDVFDTNKYNWWKQSGNPIRLNEEDNKQTDTITTVNGYEAINVTAEEDYFGGLIYSNSPYSILDGSTNSAKNCYSVGTIEKYDNTTDFVTTDDGIKVLEDKTASKVLLFSRVSVGDLGTKEVSLAKKVKIGDYISYTPSNSSVCIIYGEYTGEDSSQTITQPQSGDWVKYWRVLDKNEENGKILLISETPTNETLKLTGARGYNNGVYLLNNICKSLWSKDNKAIARSISLEDIEKFSNFDKATSTTYEKEIEYKNNLYYPNIYQKTTDAKIDGFKMEDSLKQSEQTELINEESKQANTSIFVKSNVYELDTTQYLISDMYKNLLANDYSYWIASRTNGIGNEEAEFGMFRMDTANKVLPFVLYKSNNSPASLELGIRPVVEIQTYSNWDGIGDGTKENPYGIIY